MFKRNNSKLKVLAELRKDMIAMHNTEALSLDGWANGQAFLDLPEETFFQRYGKEIGLGLMLSGTVLMHVGLYQMSKQNIDKQFGWVIKRIADLEWNLMDDVVGLEARLEEIYKGVKEVDFLVANIPSAKQVSEYAFSAFDKPA